MNKNNTGKSKTHIIVYATIIREVETFLSKPYTIDSSDSKELGLILTQNGITVLWLLFRDTVNFFP